MKSISNTKQESIPTSQLIFYLVNSKGIDSSIQKEIEDTLYKRLVKSYNVNPDNVKSFIDREMNIIRNRGEDINNYLFGQINNYEDVFNIFYQNADSITRTAIIRDIFNNLTMSELVLLYIIIQNLSHWFLYREEKIQKEINRFNAAMQIYFSNPFVSLETRNSKILEIKDITNELEIRLNEERELRLYYEYLTSTIINKIRFILGYNKREEIKNIMTIFKERILIFDLKNINNLEKKKYKNMNFNAYEHDVNIINNYDIGGFSFCKR